MSKPPDDNDDDDKVGYGRPPKGFQMQPGKSGHPAGRPKGAKNKRPRDWPDRIAEMILEEAEREVSLTEDGKKVTMSMAKAVVRSTAVNAAKGSAKAQKLFLDALNQASRYKDERHTSVLQAAIDYKESWRQIFLDCKKRGEPLPDVVPHPDHIHIDPETGDVQMTGPLTYEQRDQENRERVELQKQEIRELEAILEEIGEDEEKFRAALERDIEEAKELLERYKKIARRQHRYALPQKKR